MGEIFGIGVEELIFIGILIALMFGPESIPKFARAAGKFLNQFFRSPLYKEGQQIRQQIRDLPTALARLAQLEEMQSSIHSEIQDIKAAMTIEGDAKVSTAMASVTAAQAPSSIDAPAGAPPGDATSSATPSDAVPGSVVSPSAPPKSAGGSGTGNAD
jgi:sec-independent protein translocase protein TatB